MFDAARAGAPLADALLISCHAHLGRGWNHDMNGSDADTMVATMDRLGIDVSCVSGTRALGPDLEGGNADILAAVEQYPRRFVGTVVVNPHFPAESSRELDRWFARSGFGMLKVHPEFHAYPLDGPNYEPIWRFAAERRIPVLTHTWGFGRGFDHPDQAGVVAERHPELRLVLGHAGGTPEGLRASIAVAQRHPYVYLDTGTSLVHRGSIELLVKAVGADRVLFGTDATYIADAPQVARIAGSRLSEHEKRKIFGLNLSGLLRDADADLPAFGDAR
jgi:predicted TIM-barrel fold metal-dependent hydrolase